VCTHEAAVANASTVGLTIILCGTGQPLDSNRGRACTAIRAGDEYLVFDVGMGAEVCLSTFNGTDLSLRVTKLFITHYHSDHTGGIPNFLTFGWRTRGFKVDLYGPDYAIMKNFTEGMRKMYVVDALQRETNSNFATNTCAPIFHSPDEPNLSPIKYDTLQFNSVPFVTPPFDNQTRVVVYFNSTSCLLVEAFRVDHHIANPAVGYRVTYKGKVVVISGDTVGYPVSNAVLNAAKNADVLVHEIINSTYVTDVLAHTPAEEFFRSCQLLQSHSTIAQVANVALLANVTQLIATHIVPTPFTTAEETLMSDAIKTIYNGPVLIANDYDYVII
jgi:ribonuclease Z